jgi:hypothetical protein
VLPEEKKEEVKESSVDDIAKKVISGLGSLFSSTDKNTK